MEENILNCLVLEIEAGSKCILEYLGGMFFEKVADMQTPCGALALQACYFLILVILRNLGYSCTVIRVFRRRMLIYIDVRGVEILLLSTVSISYYKYQEAPGEVV